jgi:hypothetical protein
MLAAIPIDTLVFIALVLVASFFRWISKQAEKAKRSAEDQTRANPVQPRPSDGTDEERVRRFLEALGQPANRPPPRIERRAVTPKERRAAVPKGRTIFSPLPPLTTVPPPPPAEAKVPSVPPPPMIEPEIIRPVAPAMVTTTKILSPVSFLESAHRTTAYPDAIALLSTERGLRDAVILREIFGPPRSLQTLEF